MHLVGISHIYKEQPCKKYHTRIPRVFNDAFNGQVTQPPTKKSRGKIVKMWAG